MKIDHISISREQTWKTCQQAYKFKYHLGIIPPDPPPIYLTFGKIVHIAIEHHTKSKGQKKIDTIVQEILSGEIELQPGEKAPKLEPEYKQKLITHLGHYLRLAEKIGYDGEIEWKFKIDMDGKGRCMMGFIDRVIQKDDHFFLLDWKTTKPSFWRKDSRTITKDLQLQCYCYVVWKTYNVNPKNIQAALMFLADNKLVPVRFSEKTLASVPDRLLKVYKEIESMPQEHVYANVDRHCKFCDFVKICPFYSQQR